MQTQTITPEIVTPVGREGIRRHVIRALKLGLPVLLEQPPLVGLGMTLVANGPSARSAPLTADNSIAVNGALDLFVKQGIAPAFWISADPQALVADFLRDAPAETIYLVPSQAHPDVFRALRHHDVRLWHLADNESTDLFEPDTERVMGGCSSTLRALSLFARLGVQHFNIWGWDGCFLDGQHHATAQDAPGDVIDVRIQGLAEPFKSSHTWALEAGHAVNQLSQSYFSLTVHGPGMIAAVLRHMGVKNLLSLN